MADNHLLQFLLLVATVVLMGIAYAPLARGGTGKITRTGWACLIVAIALQICLAVMR